MYINKPNTNIYKANIYNWEMYYINNVLYTESLGVTGLLQRLVSLFKKKSAWETSLPIY